MMRKHQIIDTMNCESKKSILPYIRPALREIGFDIEDICQNESIVDGGTEPGWDD